MLAGTPTLATNQHLRNQLASFAFCENLRNLNCSCWRPRQQPNEIMNSLLMLAGTPTLATNQLLRNQLVSFAFCENLRNLRETELRFIHSKIMAVLLTIDHRQQHICGKQNFASSKAQQRKR
jgi:hypothetical protein